MKIVKRILSASLVAAMLLSMMVFTVNGAEATIYTLSLSADKTELVKGDEVVLDINISPDVKNMTSLQYTVKFDPDVFFIDGTSEDEYSPMRCFDSTWYDSFNDMYFSSNIYNAEPANGLIIYSATKLSPGASRNLDVGLPLGRFHLALKDGAVKSDDYTSVITVINAATSKHAETGGEQPAIVQNLTFTIKGEAPQMVALGYNAGSNAVTADIGSSPIIEGKLVAAAYDINKKLIDAVAFDVDFTTEKSQSYPVSDKFTGSNVAKIKVMLWNGFDTITPLVDVYSL